MNFLGVKEWADFFLGGACAIGVCLVLMIIVCVMARAAEPEWPTVGPPRLPRD